MDSASPGITPTNIRLVQNVTELLPLMMRLAVLRRAPDCAQGPRGLKRRLSWFVPESAVFLGQLPNLDVSSHEGRKIGGST